MEQMTKQAVQGISTQSLEKVWKNMSARINYVVRVVDGRFGQDNI